jgi:hypothetical protein
MRRLLFAIIGLAAVVGVGCEDYNPPQSLRTEFNGEYPNAVDIEWERRKGHVVAEFELPGVSDDCEAWYTKSGNWVMTEYKIRYSELPEAVRTSFETSYGKQTPVDDICRVERNGQPTIYFIEATIVFNGLLTDVYLDYAEDGTLLRTSADVENYDNIYYYL